MPDIRAYYNELTRTRMVNYHTQPNLRVEKAVAFVLSHVQPNDAVFEIGCGVGVLTKALAAQCVAPGCVYAVDISDDAVEVARSYVSHPNVRIERLDVFGSQEPQLPSPPTVVVFPDSLEHLPRDRHHTIFESLGWRCAPHAQVLITIPSPECLAYMAQHMPDQLQPIDESITEADCQVFASTFGGSLASYTLIDCWTPRQYVHVRITR